MGHRSPAEIRSFGIKCFWSTSLQLYGIGRSFGRPSKSLCCEKARIQQDATGRFRRLEDCAAAHRATGLGRGAIAGSSRAGREEICRLTLATGDLDDVDAASRRRRHTISGHGNGPQTRQHVVHLSRERPPDTATAELGKPDSRNAKADSSVDRSCHACA